MDSDIMGLVQNARRGDRSAVAAVIDGVLPELRAYVRVNAGADLRARESSSDVVQSICREVLEDIGGFEGSEEMQFKKWLFTLALNKIRDRHRFLKAQRRDIGREEPANTDFDQLARGYSGIYTPSGVVRARESVELIESAMAELPEDYREVITRHSILGLPQKAIAEEMGCTENAVQKLLTRARARLSMLIAKSE